MRDTQDAECAVRTPAGTWKLPDKSSRCSSTGSLSVLVMLASGSPAKELYPSERKELATQVGEGPDTPREAAGKGQSRLS